MRAVERMARRMSVNVQDLGSSPRSTSLQYYFSIYNPMQCQHQDAPYILQIKSPTCLLESNQRLRIDEHPKLESTCQHVSKKVQ